MAKKTKLVGPISCWFGFKMAQKNLKKSKTMIWTEFLKSTCKPKKVKKNPARPLAYIRTDTDTDILNIRITDG